MREAREAYINVLISDVGWLGSPENIADGLTNMTRCRVLEEFLDEGIIQTTVDQQVVRSKLTEGFVDEKEYGGTEFESDHH